MSASAPKAPKLLDNVLGPEVYVDWAEFFSLGHGTVKITFVSYRMDLVTNERTSVVIGRLVMPINGAQGLASGLYDFLKKNNLDPNPPPPTDKIQ